VVEWVLSAVKRFLIGRPLKSNELGEQRLSKIKALAVLSSDALSSVAYGPEQVLIVLATVSTIAFWYSIPIAVGVLILLAALILSYRQVIFAYPHGGGAYVVSKENLGENPGLVAGGSLLVDYILTVAVSVSSGTDALTSAFPSLLHYNVIIACCLVVIITLLNLRGLAESASILAYPVYLFVLALFILFVVGLYQIFTGHIPANHHPTLGTPVAGIGLFLLLKAFASGCSALTGVEAISNAIPNFKKPEPVNAAKTLIAMGCLLAVLFVGIVYLAYYYGVAPKATETVVSQIARETFGRNFVYFFIQGTTALILVLAANTGFSAFPMLAVNLAKDKYIARMFTIRGDRLGYSNGIIALAVASILLIIGFKGKTESLIPLYAVGVFIPFTLAQTGMFLKWIREKPPGWVAKLITNLIGAIISGTVMMMFFITKFSQVWPVLIFLPILVLVFHRIKRHYLKVGKQLSLANCKHLKPIHGNIIIVPVAGMTHVVENSLNYAKSLKPDQIIAVYVSFEREDEKVFEEKWKKWQPDVRLVTLQSYYRSIIHPLMKFIDTVEHKASESNYNVTVMIPQFIPRKRWQNILHNQTSLLIRAFLISRKNVVISTIPFHLKE
jgi:amino acid transporter